MNAFDHCGSLLDLRQILRLVPMSRSYFLAGVSQGIYPAPIAKVGRRNVWRSVDIRRMCDQLACGSLARWLARRTMFAYVIACDR